MALLRSSGKFMLNFAKISVACQVQRFILIPKTDLVMCVWYNPNKKAKFKKKQISKRFLSHNSINKNNYNNDGVGVSLITLLNRITILSNDFKNLKIDYEYLCDTIKMYAELNENVDGSVDIFLLSCCGEVLPDVKYKERQELTRKFWDLLQEKNRITSLDYYHALINVCNQNYQDINPDGFIRNMKIEPSKITYLHLLQAVAKAGDSTSINYLLSKLDKFDSFKSSNKSTENYFEKKNANILLKNVNSLELQSPNKIQQFLVCGFALRGDINNVIKILDTHSLNHKQLFTVLKNISIFEDGKFIQNILSYIPAKEVVNNPILSNTITELVHSDKINQALKIVGFFLANVDMKNSRNILKHFLQALVRADFPPLSILEINSKLAKKNRYLINNTELLLLLLEENLRCGKEHQSRSLLEKMMRENIEIRPHYYWPLLVKAAKTKGESGIFYIIDHMIKMDVRVNYDTLLEYVLPHINTLNPYNTFKKLVHYGVKTKVAIVPIISYLLGKRKRLEAFGLLDLLKLRISFDKILPLLVENFNVSRNTDDCTKLLKFAVANKDYPGEFFLQVLEDNYRDKDICIILNFIINSFKNHGIFISHDVVISVTRSKIQRNLKQNILKIINSSNIVNKTVSTPIVIDQYNPKFLKRIVNNEDELKCIWYKFKSKNIYCHDVLFRLFIISCDNDDLKQATLIKEEMKKHDHEFSSIMKYHFIQLLASYGKVNEMYSLLVDLQNSESQSYVDAIIILNATAALINANKIELVWNLIDKSPISQCHYQYQCWKVLNSIAKSKHSTLTNLMLNSLVTKNYCEINDMVLEPLITQHLVKNNLSAATKSFNYTANYYNKIPLHQELVYALIKSINDNPSKDNKLLLQEVLNKINYFNGQLAVEMDLLIAYARCNLVDELTRSLMKLPNRKISFENFIKRMSDKERSIILMRILKASIEIDWLNRQEIFELLLNSYSNMDNWKGAIELWKQMRNEGIEPSVKFKINFSTLLSVHKIQLPSTLLIRKEYLS